MACPEESSTRSRKSNRRIETLLQYELTLVKGLPVRLSDLYDAASSSSQQISGPSSLHRLPYVSKRIRGKSATFSCSSSQPLGPPQAPEEHGLRRDTRPRRCWDRGDDLAVGKARWRFWSFTHPEADH